MCDIDRVLIVREKVALMGRVIKKERVRVINKERQK